MFLSEWREFPSAPCLAGGEKTLWQLACRRYLNRARPWHASEIVSLLVGLRTYQHAGKLWNVASCWLYSANILAMHGHIKVKFILRRFFILLSHSRQTLRYSLTQVTTPFLPNHFTIMTYPSFNTDAVFLIYGGWHWINCSQYNGSMCTAVKYTKRWLNSSKNIQSLGPIDHKEAVKLMISLHKHLV